MDRRYQEMMYCPKYLQGGQERRRLGYCYKGAGLTATMSESLIMASTKATERIIRSLVVV
jgi:hypothetical protein